MPKDIIERNIKKASEANQADFQELLFEAYGPGGTGFLIECLSDNVNRSASEVRAAVTKSGGKMAEQGSVAFNFKRQGVVMLQGDGLTEDQVGRRCLCCALVVRQYDVDGGALAAMHVWENTAA